MAIEQRVFNTEEMTDFGPVQVELWQVTKPEFKPSREWKLKIKMEWAGVLLEEHWVTLAPESVARLGIGKLGRLNRVLKDFLGQAKEMAMEREEG